ncbi:MAG: DUF3592 domain-containing protein [Pontiellaceae bacterium]|jgi:hypothetical protein|nr:DUF3592 domain-containing protein [Pontiellaceae bacterium]
MIRLNKDQSFTGDSPPSRGTAAAATAKRTGKTALILFGSVFALAGLFLLKPLFVTPLQKMHAAKTWDSMPATVVSSEVKSHSDSDGTTYSIHIAYRYEINGAEYAGDRYNFIGGSSSGYERKAEVVRRYPPGQVFTLYVNPANPSESVIDREPSLLLLLGLIPAVFSLAGISLIVFAFRTAKTRLDPAQAARQVVALKGASPISKAVGITLFAVVWNGVVFLIFQSDAPILFHIIFGGIGLILIGAAIYSILATFNPRPQVEITPGDIHPGSSVAMRWRTMGNIDRIEKLVIRLRCLRVTTETTGSGKNRHTRIVKTPLYENVLRETGSMSEVAQGTLQFSIPEDQPASVPGNDDGICWQITFNGSISRWPDLKEELPFTVYPADQECN